VFPGALASHASRGARQRREAFVCDLFPAVLANAIGPLRLPVASVFGLLALLLQNLLDALGVRKLALNLGEI
jgi:hypothetical protein